MLGIRTRAGRMVGTDCSTELWQHHSSAPCENILGQLAPLQEGDLPLRASRRHHPLLRKLRGLLVRGSHVGRLGEDQTAGPKGRQMTQGQKVAVRPDKTLTRFNQNGNDNWKDSQILFRNISSL